MGSPWWENHGPEITRPDDFYRDGIETRERERSVSPKRLFGMTEEQDRNVAMGLFLGAVGGIAAVGTLLGSAGAAAATVASGGASAAGSTGAGGGAATVSSAASTVTSTLSSSAPSTIGASSGASTGASVVSIPSLDGLLGFSFGSGSLSGLSGTSGSSLGLGRLPSVASLSSGGSTIVFG